MPLVRRDPADEEELRGGVAPPVEDGGIRRRVVRLPVDEQRHDGGPAEAGLVERPAVELGYPDGEVDVRREGRELPETALGEERDVRRDALEEFRRRDVVVDENRARRETRERRERLVADREMEYEEVLGRDRAEQPPVRHDALDPGLRLDGVGVGLVTEGTEERAQREHVVADGVARSERRMELMDPRHQAG